MEEPLGYAIGNSIDIEDVEILKGKGPSYVIYVSKALFVNTIGVKKS